MGEAATPGWEETWGQEGVPCLGFNGDGAKGLVLLRPLLQRVREQGSAARPRSRFSSAAPRSIPRHGSLMAGGRQPNGGKPRRRAGSGGRNGPTLGDMSHRRNLKQPWTHGHQTEETPKQIHRSSETDHARSLHVAHNRPSLTPKRTDTQTANGKRARWVLWKRRAAQPGTPPTLGA